jgi:hypothetical protein
MTEKTEQPTQTSAAAKTPAKPKDPTVHPLTGKPIAKEIGGPKGPEPTRYGDWEQKGRCSDF